MTQDKFDHWLSQRHFAEAEEGMARRITAAAAKTPQRRRSAASFWHFSQPVYAFASLALVAAIFALGDPATRGAKTQDAAQSSISNEELMAEIFFESDDTLYY